MNKKAFPKTVEHRGASATNYLQNTRNTTRYEVRFLDVDGQQQRLTFATYEAAKELADAAVREIAENRFYVLWRYAYRTAELGAGEAIVFTYGQPVELEGADGLSNGTLSLVEKKKGK